MAAKSKEIKITRIYDAPVKMVWDAWTDTEQAAKWWGPRGFTITTHSKDLRIGGNWHYTMHGPDGTDYENTTKYLEVEMYSRLVYDHGGHADRPPLFRVTANFIDLKGKTKLEMTMALDSVEAAEETRKFIKKAGGESTWDRLGEYLAETQDHKNIFLINRSFDVSLETMFEMWTNPKHVAKWTPPTGFDMEFINVDLKPAGKGFYRMYNAQGMEMFGKTQYLEIRKPDLIQYTQQFANKDGSTSRHPMAPTWPETMLTTVRLTSEGTDQTRVTIQWEPYGSFSKEELDTFIKARSGMTQGWTGSFDKLEEYVSSSK